MKEYKNIREIFLALKKAYDEGGMDAVHEKVQTMQASEETLAEIKQEESLIDEVNKNRDNLERYKKSGIVLDKWLGSKINELMRKKK